jgi:hypothetical protein
MEGITIYGTSRAVGTVVRVWMVGVDAGCWGGIVSAWVSSQAWYAPAPADTYTVNVALPQPGAMLCCCRHAALSSAHHQCHPGSYAWFLIVTRSKKYHPCAQSELEGGPIVRRLANSNSCTTQH